MKRVFALLLTLCMLLPLAACGGTGSTSGGTGGEGGDTIVWQDSVGVQDFGGEEVVVSVLDNYEYELFGEEDSKDVLDQMEFKPVISPDLKLMDERIFRDEKMGLVLLPEIKKGV